MTPSDPTPAFLAGSMLFVLIALFLAFLYALAPLMAFGIFRRLGRLIEIQEHISQQLAALPQAMNSAQSSHAQVDPPRFTSR